MNQKQLNDGTDRLIEDIGEVIKKERNNMLARILHWFKTLTWLKCPSCGKRMNPKMIYPGYYYWSPYRNKPICIDCVRAEIKKSDSLIIKKAEAIIANRSKSGDSNG